MKFKDDIRLRELKLVCIANIGKGIGYIDISKPLFPDLSEVW